MSSPLPLILDHTLESLDLPNQPAYRKKQLLEWIYQKRVQSFDGMSNLPAGLRNDLNSAYQFKAIKVTRKQGSRDTTRKYLWQLNQGDFVESVLIPASPDLYGERADRFTLCVSSQVGCAYGCKFCASGLEGWRRNLSAGEIVAQIIEAERESEDTINNLVFMGMGEPMANYENLMQAIEIINAPWGLNIGARHITISTSGLVPRIKDLADQPKQLRLAISLHGATNEVREKIMPVNQKYPVEELIEACEYYAQRKKQMITFEFILIKGINDTKEQARELVRLAKRVHAKVNLIPYNTVTGLDWERPSMNVINQFASIVKNEGVKSTVRLEKGHDIDAACGQLRLNELRK